MAALLGRNVFFQKDNWLLNWKQKSTGHLKTKPSILSFKFNLFSSLLPAEDKAGFLGQNMLSAGEFLELQDGSDRQGRPRQGADLAPSQGSKGVWAVYSRRGRSGVFNRTYRLSARRLDYTANTLNSSVHCMDACVHTPGY